MIVPVLGFVLTALATTARADGGCENGAYRAPDGRIAAVTSPPAGSPPGEPQRYTLIDGAQGKMSDAAAPFTCAGGVLTDRAGGVWAQIPLRATPTDFTG